jgi:hypothetical protein
VANSTLTAISVIKVYKIIPQQERVGELRLNGVVTKEMQNNVFYFFFFFNFKLAYLKIVILLRNI